MAQGREVTGRPWLVLAWAELRLPGAWEMGMSDQLVDTRLPAEHVSHGLAPPGVGQGRAREATVGGSLGRPREDSACCSHGRLLWQQLEST